MKTFCYTLLWFASVFLISTLLVAVRGHMARAADPTIGRYQLRIEDADVVVFDTATGVIYVKGTNHNFIIRNPVEETQARTNDPLGLLKRGSGYGPNDTVVNP
jgi:hypothetical protein